MQVCFLSFKESSWRKFTRHHKVDEKQLKKISCHQTVIKFQINREEILYITEGE